MDKKKRLYPLKFQTNSREREWGTSDWALWSLYGASSVVSNGFLEENELDDLIETYMGDLLGEKIFTYYKGFFPIMVSMLNVKGKIPLHIHPDDKSAMEREDAFGKREFWYVMEASEDAKVFMGFYRDISAQELFDRIKSGTLEEVLNMVKPKRGDCFRINPGLPHAAWGEMKIAEISEASGAMYNIYKWSAEPTLGSQSNHDLFEAIDLVELKMHPLEPYYIQAPSNPLSSEGKVSVEKSCVLTECENYNIKKIVLESGTTIFPALINSFIVYISLKGKSAIKVGDELYRIKENEVILIPASMEEFRLYPEGEEGEQAVLLECFMPEPPEEIDSYNNSNS